MSPLFRHLLLLTALTCPGLLPAQTIPTPPARLQIPANLAAAGTTTTVNGAAWGYVVWTPSDPAWLNTREILVTLKPSGANVPGTYTPVGTVGLVTDPAVIKVLINRAAAIGEDIPKCLENSEKLIREWSTVTPAVVPAALEDRMAILTRRAQQSEFHAASLRQHGHSHPLFRMVMGLAWAGPLGVANGQDATLELRARLKSNGADAGIAGRVTVRAGVIDATSLPAAGNPVQVIPGLLAALPSTPETAIAIPRSDQAADLGVQLRWAVPEALRRQVLLTRGFHVYRVKQGYTPPLGLNSAGLEAAAAAPAPPLTNPPTYANVVRLTRNPAVARKLFRVPGSGESGPDVTDFTTDPDTHFLTDDNKRYQTSPANPKLITGTPYRENDRFDYVVTPVDLLGRLGPVSGRGEGIACRTVPPTVPDVVRVDNVIVSGNPRLRLVWKANPTPAANAAVVPTTHYLIFRDRAKNTAPAVDSLQRIEDPAQQSSLIYIGTVTQPASPGPGGTLTFDDPMLPATDDYGRTYFYTIRSVHEGPRGFMPSSPSPPVFGTFRDRTGPPAPTGNLVVQTPRVGVQASGITGSATTTASVPGSTQLRLAGTRQESTVQWFEFRIPTIVNGAPVFNTLPRLYFGRGNSVWTDILWPMPRGIIEARAGLASGRFSHWESFDINTNLNENERHTLTFTARVRTTRQLIPDDNTNADYWEKFLPSPTVVTVTDGLENTKTVSIPLTLTPGIRDYVIQAQRFGNWGTIAAASALSNAGTLVFQDTFPAPAQGYRIWRVTDPPGTPTQNPVSHEPRPENSTAAVPVNYWMSIPAGAREYRIYRRINDGALTLLKQDAGTYDATTAKSVMSEDLALPPYGGSLSYYGQVFDDHGNPSALALLGTVPFVEPQLPQPVLDTLEPKGTTAAPLMRVRAACPSPGVEYIKLTILPEPESPAGLVKVTPAPGSQQFEAGTAKDYPGALQSNAITAAVDQPAVVDVSFPIKAGVEYTVSATAISPGGKEGTPSEFQQLTWTAPIVAGEVAWPARPLPPVIDWNEQLRAFETTENMFKPRHNMVLPRSYLTYPVGIRLGKVSLPLSIPNRDTTDIGTSNWDIFPAALSANDIRLGEFAWDDGSTDTLTIPETIEQKLLLRYIPKGDVGFFQSDPPLLPVVLYRQQIGWGTVSNMTPLPNADVVQVSPLISRIESSVVVSDGRNFRVLTDPFVNAVIIHTPATSFNATAADLCLFDTTPVTYQAVYQYYLAHFDQRGEIDAIIDAGKVSITQP